MPDKKWDVLIIGGGAGGMVLALELARKGVRIAILDQKSPPIPPPRGEIIQPNGLKILDRLGLLSELKRSDIHFNHEVHFYRSSGRHLCTIDYSKLPAPYSYILILLPKVLQQLLLNKVAATTLIQTYWGATFKQILWKGKTVAGVEADYRGRTLLLHAPMVVGGDGVRSRVRDAFRIRHRVHLYADGYVTMVVNRPPGFKKDSRYYLGKGMIFGAFPVSSDKIYLFYLVPIDKLGAIQKQGIDRLKEKILSLHPEVNTFFSKSLKEVSSWKETSFMTCSRVKCKHWVVDGGALLGDAAHAMNPHVAQGRNAAMEDGITLAPIIVDCFKRGDFSRKALSPYELKRRPDVDILQGLGDEMAWLWNSGFSPIVCARNRIFRSIQAKSDLHDKILRLIAGIQGAPFELSDRWQALCPSGKH